MSLPIRLGIGMVSIYGGYSQQEIYPDNTNFRFGFVNDMYSIYGSVSIGQSVMYNVNDVVNLLYVDTNFFILPENKISVVENPLDP